jgi:CheY-like chemotaxis protein
VPDVILCDFSFPDFDGFAAQGMVREAFPGSPLIFVTGTINEERAVIALQSGAADYILKTNLVRLPSVVERVVRGAKEKKRLEISLAGSEERARGQSKRLDALWRLANDPSLQGPGLVAEILRQAAGAMRSDQVFRAVLSRIEATERLVIVVGIDPKDMDPLASLLRPGARIELDRTILPWVSRTQAWDDIAVLGNIPEEIARLG